jgi:hypothetical protein
MGDRVAFGTFDENTSIGIGGAKSAFNGLTLPIEYNPQILIDEAHFFPVGFSLPVLIKMLWRIKKFRILGALSNFGSLDFDAFSRSNYNFEPTSRERDISNAFSGSNEDDPGIEVFLTNSFFAAAHIVSNSDKTLFYPSFEINDSLGYDVSGQSTTHSGDWNGVFTFQRDYNNPNINPITFTMTPSEYWPFAAKDGSPIFDTETGEQLQDPRN